MLDLQEEAKNIFLNALKKIDLAAAIKAKLKVTPEALVADEEAFRFSDFKELIVIGLGKASLKMGSVVEEMLARRITRSLLVTDSPHDIEVESEVIVAGHPVPNANSLAAGESVIDLVRSCSEGALLLFLISGGGSALVESPISFNVNLEDIRQLNRILVECGAAIREMNVVRKHLSRIKGGRLGALARDCSYVALYVSDVNPGDVKTIASNPLLEDDATVEEFYTIVEKYDLIDKLPASVRDLIDAGIPALPKLEGGFNGRGKNILLLDNNDALEAAARAAAERGYRVEIDREHFEGKYEDIADALLRRLLEMHEAQPGEKLCLISGGEASCRVRGKGVGGRNQEFVLYSGAKLAAIETELQLAVLSCGTDGIDGNSSAAGAVISKQAAQSVIARGVQISSYIENSDSHSFFKRYGGLVITGPSGNNVRDLRVLLARNRLE